MHEFIMDRKEQKQLKAELIFAKRLGLTEDDTLDGVVSRCEKENQRRKEMLQNGEIIYGPEHFHCLLMSDMNRHVFAWILFLKVKR